MLQVISTDRGHRRTRSLDIEVAGDGKGDVRRTAADTSGARARVGMGAEHHPDRGTHPSARLGRRPAHPSWPGVDVSATTDLLATTRVVVVGQGYVGLPLAMRAVDRRLRRRRLRPRRRADQEPRRRRRRSSPTCPTPSCGPRWRPAATPRPISPTRAPASTSRSSPCRHRCATATPTSPTSPPRRARSSGYLQPGATVVLESTTYPGTTEELMVPLLEAGSGLTAGRDFAVGYSPERIDPGNRTWTFGNTPKIVSGIDAASLRQRRRRSTARSSTTVVPVAATEGRRARRSCSRTRSGTSTSPSSTSWRCSPRELDIDVWAAIDAAATKPFGFMRFTPGPGRRRPLPADRSELPVVDGPRSGSAGRSASSSWPTTSTSTCPTTSSSASARALEPAGHRPVAQPSPAARPVVQAQHQRHPRVTGAHRRQAARRRRRRCRTPWTTYATIDAFGGGVSRVELTVDEVRAADLVVVLTDHDDVDYEHGRRRGDGGARHPAPSGGQQCRVPLTRSPVGRSGRRSWCRVGRASRRASRSTSCWRCTRPGCSSKVFATKHGDAHRRTPGDGDARTVTSTISARAPPSSRPPRPRGSSAASASTRVHGYFAHQPAAVARGRCGATRRAVRLQRARQGRRQGRAGRARRPSQGGGLCHRLQRRRRRSNSASVGADPILVPHGVDLGSFTPRPRPARRPGRAAGRRPAGAPRRASTCWSTQLAALDFDWQLRIVGDGPLRARPARRGAARPTPSRIQFLGVRTHAELPGAVPRRRRRRRPERRRRAWRPRRAAQRRARGDGVRAGRSSPATSPRSPPRSSTASPGCWSSRATPAGSPTRSTSSPRMPTCESRSAPAPAPRSSRGSDLPACTERFLSILEAAYA